MYNWYNQVISVFELLWENFCQKSKENLRKLQFSLHARFENAISHHKNKIFQHWISQKCDTSNRYFHWRKLNWIGNSRYFIWAKCQRKKRSLRNSIHSDAFEGMHRRCLWLAPIDPFSVASPTVHSPFLGMDLCSSSFTHRHLVPHAGSSPHILPSSFLLRERVGRLPYI